MTVNRTLLDAGQSKILCGLPIDIGNDSDRINFNIGAGDPEIFW
jgi:hypothetical protein